MIESRLLRYRDLLAMGVIRNRTTLSNWVRDRNFPRGVLAGPNTRVWTEGEIERWLKSRPTESKPVLPAKRPRGRPRKIKTDINAAT